MKKVIKGWDETRKRGDKETDTRHEARCNAGGCNDEIDEANEMKEDNGTSEIHQPCRFPALDLSFANLI